MVNGIKGGHDASFPAPLHMLAIAGPHIHLASEQSVAVATREPLRLGCGIGQRLEYLRRRSRVGPFDAERRVHHRARRTTTCLWHGFLLPLRGCSDTRRAGRSVAPTPHVAG